MFKTQLSSNLIPEKAIIAVIPIITVFLGPALGLFFILVFFLGIIFVLYSIYTVYFVPVNLVYDDLHLFITDRKREKIIALKNISCIKPSSNYISLRKRREISYSENGVENELYFYPMDDSFTLATFIKTAKAQNQSIDCATINFD
ncbi:MAG: hypothetical protein ACXVB0_07630 [Mucilaginibacter sp.]